MSLKLKTIFRQIDRCRGLIIRLHHLRSQDNYLNSEQAIQFAERIVKTMVDNVSWIPDVVKGGYKAVELYYENKESDVSFRITVEESRTYVWFIYTASYTTVRGTTTILRVPNSGRGLNQLVTKFKEVKGAKHVARKVKNSRS